MLRHSAPSFIHPRGKLPTADFTATWMRRRASNVYGRPVFLARVGGIAFALTLMAFAFLARSEPRELRGRAPRARAGRYHSRSRPRRNARSARLRDAENALATARAQPGRVQCSATRFSRRARTPRFARCCSPRSSRDYSSAPTMRRSSHPSARSALPLRWRASRVSRGCSTRSMISTRRARISDRPMGWIRYSSRSRRAWDRSATSSRRQRERSEPPCGARSSRSHRHPVVGIGDRHGAARGHSRFGGAPANRSRAQLASAVRADSVARARAEDAPGIFGVGMPTLVLAAGVVAAVFALALALALELHWPTVADVAEAESLSGTRVLVTIGEKIEEPERQRRSSDREIPPSIEQSSTRIVCSTGSSRTRPSIYGHRGGGG